MIYIKSIKVKNFRRFIDVEIPFKKKTVLLGENNTGKSSILDILEAVFNPTRRTYLISEEDISHGSPEGVSIQVIIEIRPMENKKFRREEQVIFDPNIDILEDESERLLLEFKYSYDEESEEYRPRLNFIKSDGNDSGFVRHDVKRSIPLFVIPALRSAAHDLMSKSGTWVRMVGNMEIAREKREKVKSIADNVAKEIMQILLGEEKLSKTRYEFMDILESVLWGRDLGGEMSFSVLPPNQREFIQSLQIMLRNPGDIESLAIMSHGEGTQSVAVVALMMAYVSSIGFPNAIIAVEEPENHLHPHATRALVSMLHNKEQQVILTTHSSDVADIVQPMEIVLLKRRGAKTVARYIPDDYFTPNDLNKILRFIRSAGSEMYFAKCILLTEGETEHMALPVFARALGINLDQLGISIVGVSGEGSFETFIRLFQAAALDIPYLIMCDKDQAANDTSKVLKNLHVIDPEVDLSNIENVREKLESAGLYFLPNGDFERYVIEEGFEEEYTKAFGEVFGTTRMESYFHKREMSDSSFSHKSRTEKIIECVKHCGGKPEIAIEFARIITKDEVDPKSIPSYFVKTLKEIERIAKREIEVENDGEDYTQTLS